MQSPTKEWKTIKNSHGVFLKHKKNGRLIILPEGKSVLDPDVMEVMLRGEPPNAIEVATMRSTCKDNLFGADGEALKNATSLHKIDEIKHGKDPILVLADAAGKKYIFKELVEGSEIYWQNWRFDKVCREIGWTHLSPRVAWREWDGKRGMIVEFFEGVNAATLEEIEVGVVTAMDKVDPTDVIRCALLDGLCVSRDRHSNNVMLDAEGRIALIDNTHCFKKEDRSRSVFVGTRPTKHTPNLYYRFYVKGGAVGTSFPPEYKAYLEKISATALDQLCLDFHFDDADRASAFRFRAKDMLSSGFEHVCAAKE